MKKLLSLIAIMAMSLSLVACGAKDEPAANTTPEVKVEEPVVEDTTTEPEVTEETGTEEVEYTPEQQEAAQSYLDMAARYDEVAAKVNEDANLSQLQDVVDLMNEIADAILEADEVFADPANLTDDVLVSIADAIAQTNLFLDEVEAMLTNYGGQEIVVAAVEIVNNTGADFYQLCMSPTSNETWGANLLDEALLNGESGITEMAFTADTLVWDLIAADSEGNTVTFTGIDFTEAPVEGAQLVLVLEDGEYYAAFAE